MSNNHKRIALSTCVASLIFAALPGAGGCGGTGYQGGSCGDMAGCPGTDPTGTWNAVGKCQFYPSQADQPLSFSEYTQTPQDPTLPAPQPQPSTGGDWCSELRYLPPTTTNPEGSVAMITLWHQPAPFQSGTFTFNGDKTYSASLTFSTQGTTHFSPPCLQSQGFTPTCGQLANQINAFYTAQAMANSSQSAYVAPEGAPAGSGVQCQTSSSDGGCDCFYTFRIVLTDQGQWAVSSSGILTQTSITYEFNGRLASVAPQAPMASSVCASSGNTLTITGFQGASLEVARGLRTLVLQKQ